MDIISVSESIQSVQDSNGEGIVQAIDENGNWYNVRGVEEAIYHDSEGKSVVAVLKLVTVK